MCPFVLPIVGGIFACSSVVAFGSVEACSLLMIMVASGRVGDGGRNQKPSGKVLALNSLCHLLDNHQVVEQRISLHTYFSFCFI